MPFQFAKHLQHITINMLLRTALLNFNFFLKPMKMTRAILAQLQTSNLLSAQSVGFTGLLHLCLLPICGSLLELHY